MSTNLQYWINQNGQQSGPYTLEQLQTMTLHSTDTYVWHKGMDGWMRIDKVPELAHLVAHEPAVAAQTDEALQQGGPQEQSEAAPTAEDFSGAAQESASADEAPSATQPPAYTGPEPSQVPPFMQQQPSWQAPQPVPECPPTNLVASIVCAVMCCTPLAVVAIVLAVLTKNKYLAGDYAKAQKYSEWGAWLCILSVVCAVLFSPISMLVL